MDDEKFPPVISVIIPIYNTIKYIPRAVDSILRQKEYIKQLILVDDGSTDGSGKLIEDIYGKEDKIKIIHTDNHGQGHARNAGTEIADGDFIYYFDSDDIAHENLLEKFYSELYEYPELEIFCFSGESFLDEDSVIEDISKKNYLNKEAYRRKINAVYQSGEEAFNVLVDKKSFFAGPPLYIFKRNLLIKNKLEFQQIKYEDEEFTHRLFLYGGLTIISDTVLFRRRVRSGSTMQVKRTFADLLGYFQTIETLSELKKRDNLKEETKKTIKERIKTFVQLVIDLKIQNRIILNKEEKKIFRRKLSPHIKEHFDLFLHYYFYPFEYKLRILKKKYFTKK